MRKTILAIFFTVILSCNSSTTDNYKNLKKDNSNAKDDAKRNIRGQDTLDYNDDEYLDQLIVIGTKEDIDKSITMLENEIILVCDSAIHFLQSYKDTTLSYGLIKSLKMEKETFKNHLLDESEIIFMSFGKLSTAHEDRQAAADGYYYLTLKEKYNFLKNSYQNIKDNFEFP